MKRPIQIALAVMAAVTFLIGHAAAERVTTGQPPKLVIIPDDGFAPIVKLISDATRSIDLVMYRLDDPQSIAALKAAATRGVNVRVMLEKHPDEGAAANRATESALKGAGVFTAWTNPEFKETMERAAAIDKSLAFVSTFDLIEGDRQGCRGFAAVLKDPRDVSDVSWMYEADWTRVRANPLRSNLTWNPGGARTRLLAIIRQAKKWINIYADDIKDEEVAASLKEAIARGVVVKIIAGPKVGRGKAALNKMRMAGARVRHLQGMELCARALIADDGSGRSVAIIGAARIAEAHREKLRALGVIVSDKDRLLAISRTFDRDWSRSKG